MMRLRESYGSMRYLVVYGTLRFMCVGLMVAASLPAAGCGQAAQGQQSGEVQADGPPAGRVLRKFLAKRKERRKARAAESADVPAVGEPALSGGGADEAHEAGRSQEGGLSAVTDPPPEKPRRLTLEEALDLAREGIERAAALRDYTCTFLKRERVGRTLGEEQRLFMKIRHEPFSVYTRFEAPADLKGQEALYVEGQNDGMLIAHTTGLTGKVVGTVRLDPTGYLAMNGNRHPITSAGIKNLLVQLVALGESEPRAAQCAITYGPGPEIDERPCQRLEIVQKAPQGDFRLARVQVDIDEEWQLPVHYAAYEWSKGRRPQPELVEEYTYLDLRFNVGLTDRDFDPTNTEYSFP